MASPLKTHVKAGALKLKTSVKAGRAVPDALMNHNETMRRSGLPLKTHVKAGALKLKTSVKAGRRIDITMNHNETLAHGLKIRTAIRAGVMRLR